MIGLVNGQEKLTITESILLRYTAAAVVAQCRQRRGKGGARAAASYWCSGGCFVPSGRPLDPRRAVGRSENPEWGTSIDVIGIVCSPWLYRAEMLLGFQIRGC